MNKWYRKIDHMQIECKKCLMVFSTKDIRGETKCPACGGAPNTASSGLFDSIGETPAVVNDQQQGSEPA